MAAEEELIDKQILKKYEIQTKLGKGAYGVSALTLLAYCVCIRGRPGACDLPRHSRLCTSSF